MSRDLLIEELHTSVYVPRGLPKAEYEAVRQTLDDARFLARLRRAVRHVVRHYSSLRQAWLRLPP
jgi:hypothetical protein